MVNDDFRIFWYIVRNKLCFNRILFTSTYAINVTQKVLEGRGIVKEPHKNTINGNGVESTEAFLIWWRNTIK
jgi:hypothetical protein